MKSGTKKSLFYFVLMNKVKDIQQMDISKTKSCKIHRNGLYLHVQISLNFHTDLH